MNKDNEPESRADELFTINRLREQLATHQSEEIEERVAETWNEDYDEMER